MKYIVCKNKPNIRFQFYNNNACVLLVVIIYYYQKYILVLKLNLNTGIVYILFEIYFCRCQFKST